MNYSYNNDIDAFLFYIAAASYGRPLVMKDSERKRI